MQLATYLPLDCLVVYCAFGFKTGEIVALHQLVVGEKVNAGLIELRPGEDFFDGSNCVSQHSGAG